MSPALITAIIGYAVKYGPVAAQALTKLFTKKEVSPQELSDAFALAELSYDEIVHPNRPPTV